MRTRAEETSDRFRKPGAPGRLNLPLAAAAAALLLFTAACGDRDLMRKPQRTAPAFDAPALNPVLTPTNLSQAVISGSAAPSSSIEVIGTVTAAGTADSQGNFSISIALATSPGAETLNSLAVRYVAGTDSSAWATAFILHDPVAPPAPVLSGIQTPTSSQTISVSGTTEPGCRVAISGPLVGATADADGLGAFSAQVVLYPNASNAISAVSTDAAGNQSAAASAMVVHDSIPPKAAESAKLRAYFDGTSVRVSGGYMCVEPLVTVTVENTFTLASVSVTAGANGAFNAALAGGGDGQQVRVACTDAALNTSPLPDPLVQVSQNWSEIPDSGPPSARFGSTLTIDMVNNRAILFGGRNAAGTLADSCWSLDLSPGSEQWTQITASGPPAPRFGHAAIYDFYNRRVVIFGGENGAAYFGDVWTLDVATPGSETWAQLSTTGMPGPPAARAWHTAVLNQWSGGMLVFGGKDATTVYDEVWDLHVFNKASPVWVKAVIFGSSPAPRWGHSACVDIAGVRMLVFGGIVQGGAYSQELWSYTLSGGSAWFAVSAASPPSARAKHAAFEDGSDSRMIIFGGDTGLQRLNDAHSFDMAANSWSDPVLTNPLVKPLSRECAAAAFDLNLLKCVMFGGAADGSSSAVFGDLWQLK